MKKGWDLLAISFLMFAAVMSIWLGLWGPTNTTSWKEWQPLMAAFVALGAAALAYKAAMAKVELDRKVAREADERRMVGLYLRVGFAARVLQHEATILNRRLEKPSLGTKTLSSKTFHLGDIPAPLTEAWTEIALFPRSIAGSLSAIRIAFYNLDLLHDSADENVAIPAIGPDRKLVVVVRESLENVVERCGAIRSVLRLRLEALGVGFH